MILEACVESLAAAKRAEYSGAHQLELCRNLSEDGLSPDVSLAEQVIKAVDIPVKLMVRLRPGNFIFTRNEKDQMIKQLKQFESLDPAGYVVGALTEHFLPDLTFINELSKYSNGKAFTFHKAIDVSSDIIKSLELLENNCPSVKFILSSGQAMTAELGKETLKTMDKQLNRIKLIAAGKITKINLRAIDDYLKLDYYHGRKIV